MTIDELYIQLDIHSDDKLSILEDAAYKYSSTRYLFVDSLDGHCYLFNKNGNEDDVKKLKRINDCLFYDSNISSIIIPDSVKSIGYEAFEFCENLKSIVISDSIKSIGYHAFAFCTNLKSLIFKGKTIKQIKEMDNYPFGIKDESIIRCC